MYKGVRGIWKILYQRFVESAEEIHQVSWKLRLKSIHRYSLSSEKGVAPSKEINFKTIIKVMFMHCSLFKKPSWPQKIQLSLK